ncbi:putative N-acetyltransferase domain-containing protein [Seiridium cardinale]|uniref:N-acetyltransferase domain-containing protein n=1 Tax=Seiridium cardinale TaxID=138064 RepID=A0ABR2XFX3_9PEZI
MTSTIANVSVHPATKDDLDALVKIQFAALGQFGPEPLISGNDTPENRSIMTKRHAQHMDANPELVIAKAQLVDGKIAGFCMFYFPGQGGAGPEQERTPTPLRPPSADPAWAQISLEAPWIEETERRRKAESFLRFIHQEVQKYVGGRKCAYVRYMCVDPSFQRQGIGKALMMWACVKLDKLKLDAYLEASPAGEGLYRQFGFEIIGHSKGDFEDGLAVEYSHMWRMANS